MPVPATIPLKNNQLPVDLETSSGGGLCSLEKPLNIWEELLLTFDYFGGGFRAEASHLLGLPLEGNRIAIGDPDKGVGRS